MSKKNIMGSEVENGFRCKPRELDENRPIMFSAVHLFLCEGKRCRSKSDVSLADRLRKLVKHMGLDSGRHRIKITRTACNGACRYGQFAYTYKNAAAECFSPHNAFTAWKNVDKWREKEWKQLFHALISNEEPRELEQYKVDQHIFPHK